MVDHQSVICDFVMAEAHPGQVHRHIGMRLDIVAILFDDLQAAARGGTVGRPRRTNKVKLVEFFAVERDKIIRIEHCVTKCLCRRQEKHADAVFFSGFQLPKINIFRKRMNG